MQPWAEEGPPRGTGSQNSPPLLPNESAEPGESPLLGLVLTLIAPRAGPEGRCQGCRRSAKVSALTRQHKCHIHGMENMTLTQKEQARLQVAASGDEADGELTFGEAFAVQPFGNSLVTMSLTGAQIDALLEAQFVDAEVDTRRVLQVSKWVQVHLGRDAACWLKGGRVRHYN